MWATAGADASSRARPPPGRGALVNFLRRGGKRLSIFFATDLHGSRVCFRKFLAAPKFYEADVLILGGDMTGKMVVPIAEEGKDRFTAQFGGARYEVDSAELPNLETMISDAGFYPYRTSPAELAELQSRPERVDEIFRTLMLQRLREWAAVAEEKLAGSDIPIYVAPGNDDPWYVDDVLRELPRFRLVEGDVTTLDGRYEMLTTGFSNETPWKTPREVTEEELYAKIAELAGRISSMSSAIFNIHVPPYASGLDTGPDLDPVTLKHNTRGGQPVTKPVGSVAVERAISEFGPMLSLHGHIHESRGTVRIGRTLCVNPGSDYGERVLRGCLVQLGDGKVQGYQLTSG